MATVTLSAKDPATVSADVLVVFLHTVPGRPPQLVAAERFAPALRRALTEAAELAGSTGAVDSLVRVPAPAGIAARAVAFAGTGASAGAGAAALGGEALRRAVGSAVRQLAGVARVAVTLPRGDAEAVAAAGEGALLGAYSYDRYRTGSGAVKAPVATVTLATPEPVTAGPRAAVRRAKVLASAVHGARDLVNAAPVDLYPAVFADEAVAAVDGMPVTVSVWDERKLARGGFGGLLGVGKGSARPPRLVRMAYAPSGAVGHLALVGKGITFDSGGVSIKPAQGMEAMKSDMAGAAAVLHAVVAAAALELPLRVTGWLALAENMPSGTAQRPSDVLTMRGGRTVEVLNTDAEGRLVLADALVAAGEEEPDAIVDIATLTGAQMVALGNRISAIMGNNDAFRDRVHRVADESGEQFWPMPLPPELRSGMDSRVADIANIGDRFGGMLTAGLFLQEFVTPAEGSQGAPVPWAHLDIAGPAFNTGSPFGYTPSGATGVGVRTLVKLCEDLALSPLA